MLGRADNQFLAAVCEASLWTPPAIAGDPRGATGGLVRFAATMTTLPASRRART